MNSNNLEKLNVYRLGSVWLRIYLFGYLFGFLIIYAAVMLNALTDTDVWQAVTSPLTGGAATFESTFALFAILLILSAVINAALLPMLNKPAFVATMIHLGFLVVYRPLIWLISKLVSARVPAVFLKYLYFLWPAALIFAGFNFFYFCRRKDLFDHDIVRLVTDQEKENLKSLYH